MPDPNVTENCGTCWEWADGRIFHPVGLVREGRDLRMGLVASCNKPSRAVEVAPRSDGEPSNKLWSWQIAHAQPSGWIEEGGVARVLPISTFWPIQRKPICHYISIVLDLDSVSKV